MTPYAEDREFEYTPDELPPTGKPDPIIGKCRIIIFVIIALISMVTSIVCFWPEYEPKEPTLPSRQWMSDDNCAWMSEDGVKWIKVYCGNINGGGGGAGNITEWRAGGSGGNGWAGNITWIHGLSSDLVGEDEK